MTVKLDSITTLNANEVEGVLDSLTRVAIVHGLTGTDYTVLDAALDEAGVPAAGATLSGTNLILMRRSPRLNAKGVVEIELEYLPNTEDSDGWTWSGSATLSGDQITTSGGTALSVAYAYPADYKLDPSLAGQTITQGKSLPIMRPQFELKASGKMTLAANTPEVTMNTWLGGVNNGTWKGLGAGKALVAGCSFETVDYTAKIYKFDWTFQYKAEGWQPSYYFIDPNTGLPPHNLVVGTGFKTLTWFPAVDFSTLW